MKVNTFIRRKYHIINKIKYNFDENTIYDRKKRLYKNII